MVQFQYNGTEDIAKFSLTHICNLTYIRYIFVEHSKAALPSFILCFPSCHFALPCNWINKLNTWLNSLSPYKHCLLNRVWGTSQKNKRKMVRKCVAQFSTFDFFSAVISRFDSLNSNYAIWKLNMAFILLVTWNMTDFFFFLEKFIEHKVFIEQFARLTHIKSLSMCYAHLVMKIPKVFK